MPLNPGVRKEVGGGQPMSPRGQATGAPFVPQMPALLLPVILPHMPRHSAKARAAANEIAAMLTDWWCANLGQPR